MEDKLDIARFISFKFVQSVADDFLKSINLNAIRMEFCQQEMKVEHLIPNLDMMESSRVELVDTFAKWMRNRAF